MNRIFQKAILIFASFLLFHSALLKAQAFKEGDDTISAGYGFGVLYPENYLTIDNGSPVNFSYLGPCYL